MSVRTLGAGSGENPPYLRLTSPAMSIYPLGDMHPMGSPSGDEYASARFRSGTLLRKNELEKKILPDHNNGSRMWQGQIVGHSMWPEIKKGDFVAININSKITDVRVGNNVTAIMINSDRTEEYYTHKVVAVVEGAFGGTELVTKGVNNARQDPHRVDASSFIGITTFVASPTR